MAQVLTLKGSNEGTHWHCFRGLTIDATGWHFLLCSCKGQGFPHGGFLVCVLGGMLLESIGGYSTVDGRDALAHCAVDWFIALT